VRVLVVNAGSSSLKLALVGAGGETLGARELDAPDERAWPAALAPALEGALADADAIGCRIVHGGDRFCAPVRVDEGVRGALGELVDLAPLHQPRSLAALDAVCARLPGVPAVACFDTAFHATMPPAATTYALPAAWRARWAIRRYGFHGLSHGWIARRAPELLGASADAGTRIVSCHLGAGASLCAIAGGRSVDTTMGFTPLEGLVMATRSGSVDPGMLLWLLEREQLGAREMTEGLEHCSGLLGLCGTADMREVLARADAGDAQAELALEVYIHSLRAGIGAMTAALGGLDALVFTGGVGERSAAVRELTVGGLAFIGLAIDGQLNSSAAPDVDVSAARASAATIVLAAREDLEIARQVRAALADP
jgi:acetate kinase